MDLGDSIAAGFGPGNATFGGAAVPADATVYDGSVTPSATYANAGLGSSPNPGHIPYIVNTFLAAGHSHVNVVRVAVGGSTTAQVRTLRLGTLTGLLTALGLTPDLFVICTGTNDSNSEAEALAFETELPKLCDDIERTWATRIILITPAVQPATKTHSDEVRATCVSVAGAKGSRGVILGIAGDLTGDAVHNANVGDERQGEETHPVWLTLS